MWPPLNGRATVRDRCLAGGLAALAKSLAVCAMNATTVNRRMRGGCARGSRALLRCAIIGCAGARAEEELIGYSLDRVDSLRIGVRKQTGLAVRIPFSRSRHRFGHFGSFTPTSVRRSFLNSQVSGTRSQKPPTGKAVLPYGGFREEAPHEEGNDRVNLGWEDSPSGLWRSLGKRVGFTPSGVQIPYPPRRQQSGVHRFGAPRPLLVFFSAVACPSGQRSTPRKRVWG